MSGWNCTIYTNDDGDEFANVKPIADTRIHTVGSGCWCEPQIVEDEGYRPIIAHNSLDKRELYEYDNPLNNPLA